MRKTLIATAAAAAMTIGLTGPASAELYGIDDPEGGGGSGVNLLAVSINNSKTNLRIDLVHQNLRRSPSTGAGAVIYIDTDPESKGPELVFTGGLFAGTDYQLLTTEGFGPNNWGDPVEGKYSMKLDYANEQTHLRIGRNALGGADEVRVAIRVSGQRTNGSAVVDWLGKPRSFTKWLDRG